MSLFQIEIDKSEGAGPDDARPISVQSGSIVFTRLLRAGHEQLDDYVRAPPAQLAFWLVDNWWRLRHECIPPGRPSAEWRLAHNMASIGGGYVWPRLSLWGEGGRVGLESRSDPPGMIGPVRYVTDTLPLSIPGHDFDRAVDSFLELAVHEQGGFGSDRAALRAQWNALQAERRDPAFAEWRRLEAQLGFDPDEGPESLLTALAELVGRYGGASIEEAVQAFPREDTVNVLNREIAAARDFGWDCDLSEAVQAAGTIDRSGAQVPWQEAEQAGSRVRRALGLPSGPIASSDLAGLTRIDRRALESDARQPMGLEYGLRLRSANNVADRIAFRRPWPASRRFELGRALGDAIWARTDSLGPLAQSKTARQKFQKAFAQSLLCPFDDLMSYMSTSNPTDDDIAAAARHFDVSERVVRTTLVNKKVIERERLEDYLDVA